MDGVQVDIMKDLSRLSDGYPFMITVYQASCKRNVDGARTVDCNCGYCGLDLWFQFQFLNCCISYNKQWFALIWLLLVAMTTNYFHFQVRK